MKLKLILTAGIVGLVAELGAAAAARADPFAYVTNHADSSVSQYDIGAGGLLAPLSPATVAAGTSPFEVAVSPDGQSAYVTNHADASVSQYDIGAGGSWRHCPRPPSPPGSTPRGSR